MRRVVVTGLGIVSPIGNTAAEVEASLRAGKSGIVASPEMAEHGFRSQIAGTLKIDVTEHVDKRTLRFMGPGAAYAHIAMTQAIADAGLDETTISNPRTGLVAGSGGPSTSAMFAAHKVVETTGATKRIGPFADWAVSGSSAGSGPMMSAFGNARVTGARRSARSATTRSVTKSGCPLRLAKLAARRVRSKTSGGWVMVPTIWRRNGWRAMIGSWLGRWKIGADPLRCGCAPLRLRPGRGRWIWRFRRCAWRVALRF